MRSTMDLSFNTGQEQLRQDVRAFLAQECDRAVVRELEESELGSSPEMWKKMAGARVSWTWWC